ncbi:hypothetical protein F511_29320 [Dorcoceras hygrometricum]|uniref:Uncharacterized protein n=1 Tax=Dorcoceras hygrometricum TaxID=472368 RepID=A0A2Z7DFR8_9LAMI|nr:hypothetical protein F511_29320 [Dorcoceras hygrometricum]
MPIRSTTGCETPSSACTRRPDETDAMDSPRKVGRKRFSGERRRRGRRAAAAARREVDEERGGVKSHSQNPLRMLNKLRCVSVRESRIQYLCDPQWFRDTASRGPTTIVAPESRFRTCPSDHDNIGYPRMSASGESSTTMHRLLHASGSHPIPTPYDPKRVLAILKEKISAGIGCRCKALFKASKI